MTAPLGTRASAADIRQTVGEIVQTILDRDVNSAVDLFDQGATSMAFIRIVAEVNKRYEITLDVTELEEASTDTLSGLVAEQLGSQESVKARS
jgi:acyl carrier protein